MIKNILVLGGGNVGQLVAKMLSSLSFNVTICDLQKIDIPKVEFLPIDCSDLAQILNAKNNSNADTIVSCLPFFLNRDIVAFAVENGLHYFDLTEDVETTEFATEISKDSKTLLVPQNGLAPGFIILAAANLLNKFDNHRSRYLRLRVGALPQNPIGTLGYACNWSVDGLVNEYLSECDIIENGRELKAMPLTKKEVIRIDGGEYEAFLTSGGVGTLTKTLKDKVENLNYKTIRYKGHLDGMRLILKELRLENNRELLSKILLNALPHDSDDIVLVHASAQGEINGRLHSKEFVKSYKPMTLFGKTQTAISWTTASAISGVIELASKGSLGDKGFIRQEDIPFQEFLSTKMGSNYCK